MHEGARLGTEFIEPAQTRGNIATTGGAATSTTQGSAMKRPEFTVGFGMASMLPHHERAASQIAAAYRIDGVPTLAVDGRFKASPELVGSEQRAPAGG